MHVIDRLSLHQNHESANPNVADTPAIPNLVPPPKRVSLRPGTAINHSHLDSLVTTTTDDLVCDKIDTVNLVGVSRQIDSDLVLLQVPKLAISANIAHRAETLTLSVESLLALTSIRESADQATR